MPSGKVSGRTEEMASIDDMEEIKRSLNFMSSEMTKLTSLQERMFGLIDEVKVLKAWMMEKDRRISELEQRVDELEQYTRREDLAITGLEIRHKSYTQATANLSSTEDAPEEDLLTL